MLRCVDEQASNSHLLLMPCQLRRSDKSLCAMAAGNWILDAQLYLRECSSLNMLVAPNPVWELDMPAQGEQPLISAGAPRHWRTRQAATCKGAFAGLRAAIVGNLPKPLDVEAVQVGVATWEWCLGTFAGWSIECLPLTRCAWCS